MKVSSASKICLMAVGLVLIACNVVCIAWLFVAKSQTSIQSPSQYCGKIASVDMPRILDNIGRSSEAHCFLKVSKDDTYTTDLGPVRWEEEGSPSGISLDKNRSRIIVNSNGHYIVSVQAIFILENYTADERLRIELMANDKDALVVAWDEREVKDHLEEQTLRLSLLVLLELVKGQHISVKARHRDKFNYNTPISTFLTMIKYSNLQGVHNGTGPVYT